MKLSAELKKKVEEAYSNNRIVGDTIFSDTEYESLLSYTRYFSSQFLKSGSSCMSGDDAVHFVTLVEIAKRWKKANDNNDDEDDNESGFWPHVYNSVKTDLSQWTNQKEYSAYIGVIRRIEKTKQIPSVTKGHRFYATLMMHAFAPKKSIYAFLDLCYNIYKKDLEFNYTESDKWVCDISTIRFCDILEDSIGDDKAVSIGTNTYSVQIGLRSLALDSATQNDFSALIDRSLTAIHKLFQGQEFSQRTYFDGVINSWWQGKLAESTDDKKHCHRTLSAVTKHTITVKLMRDEHNVNLVIPPIRLDNVSKEIWLSVYAGQGLQQRYSAEIPTRHGELMVTTVQKEFDLATIFKNGEPIKLHIEISENGILIFEKTIEREFILFDGENEILSQINRPNNYFVYTQNIDALQMPLECNRVWNSSNLYNIYPKADEMIKGMRQYVYFVNNDNLNNKTGEVRLLGSFFGCKWRNSDISCMVFGGTIQLVVPNDISLNGLELRTGISKKLLTKMIYVQEDGIRLFDIIDKIEILEPVEVALYSHLKEKNLFKENIMIFPSLNVSFSKSAYYGLDEKKVTISFDGGGKVLTWDNTQSEIAYPINDGELVVKIPYTRWRIDGKSWQNERLQSRLWYKQYFHDGSLLEIESAIDTENAVLYAFENGFTQNQDVIERNKVTGKFEIGRYIYSNLGKEETVFLLKLDRQHSVELFSISTVEHFEHLPLGVLHGKVVFIGNNSFIGESERKFTLEFKSVGREIQVFESDKLENDILPINKGIY